MRHNILLVVLISGVLLLLAPATAEAQVAEFTSLAGASCSPLPFCAIPQRGTISCTGGNEASPGLMPPWCPGESRTKVRGRVLVYQILRSNDSRISGTVTLVVNMNLETQASTGHLWGSYLIEVPGRGSWEGIWEGKALDATKWAYRVTLVGSGEFDGLQVKADGLWKYGAGDLLTGQIKPVSD